MTKFILILLGLGAAAHSAWATSEGVIEIDTNGDGLLSAHEMQAVYPDITAQEFARIDTNNDGALDDAEMVAAQAKGLLPAPGGG